MSDEFAYLSILLRAIILIGSVGAAGAVLYVWSMKVTAPVVERVLEWQLFLGVAFIILIEPLRYWLFLMAATGNDFDLALSKDMLMIGIETPSGQAGLIRITGALMLAVFGLRKVVPGLAGAALLIVSYGFEGHMAANENRIFATLLLLVHITVVHWWLGALLPLIAETRASNLVIIAGIAERFGRIATILVPVLLLAGGIMLGGLTDWKVDLSNDYQWRAVLKLALVALLLSLAALNKFRLTPQLRSGDQTSARRLRSSIYLEVFIALGVLVLTSYLTAHSPEI